MDSKGLDYFSERINGHTNWAFADAVEPKILKRELKKSNVIIFFDDAVCSHCDKLKEDCNCEQA